MGVTSFYVVAIFITWDLARVYTERLYTERGFLAISSSKWDIVFVRRYAIFPSGSALISQMICFPYHGLALCNRRVPPRDHDWKHNLISAFICKERLFKWSNKHLLCPVLCLPASLFSSSPSFPSLPSVCFGLIHYLENAFEAMQMRTSEQMNVS